MKHLLFVSVAVGIFSGTSLSGKAQVSINSLWKNSIGISKNSPKFIESVEVKTDSAAIIEPLVSKPDLSQKLIVTESKPLIESCSALQFKYAQLLHTEVESVINIDLFDFVDEWWATRYRYGGTTKSGIDCSAYVGTLINQVYGIILPRTARAQYSVCEKISRDSLQQGDLVFFNTIGGVSHVGVYLDNGYFTHCGTSSGVTISSLNDNYYNKRFISGGRYNTEPKE